MESSVKEIGTSDGFKTNICQKIIKHYETLLSNRTLTLTANCGIFIL